MIVLQSRVIVTKRIAEESVLPGDVGTIIEEYRDAQDTITGYELAILSVEGHTLAVCAVPADAVREATVTDRLSSRMGDGPIIDEIRAVRYRISEEFGHDPEKLCEHYMTLQERHRDRLVRRRIDLLTRVPDIIFPISCLAVGGRHVRNVCSSTL
jgi:hypothetical protein